LFQKKLAAKTGAIIYTKREKHTSYFEMDGVQVMRIPLYKIVPHGKFARNRLEFSQREIAEYLNSIGFTPDIITGHFLNPQLEMLDMLKRRFSRVRTCLVFHLPAEFNIADKLYGKDFLQMIGDVDYVGFRNAALEREFKRRYQQSKKTFICYSGIPESFITEQNTHTFNGDIKSFIYVGGLIERKYPAQVVDALHEAFPEKDFMIEYVGAGQQSSVIAEKAKQYGIEDNVKLLGKIDRSAILERYDKSDCMVMISKGEAYGLVYLEAMARGCITIASKDEGMDGVIVNGENGFLCTAGDSKELAGIIRHINTLSNAEKQQISEKAIKTASELTDYKAAKKYLDDLCS
jgi:glycosyltransferase involved in cell wall biosynthesis